MSITTSRTQPVLLGGLVMGVLSALPVVSAANLCCCLWVVSGGLVAAYLLQQNQSEPITAADGALVGLLAGIAGAFINVVVAIPVDMMVAPLEQALVETARDMTGAMPPGVRDLIEQMRQQRASGGFGLVLVQRVVWFFIVLVLGAIFSTLGGVLGVALFRKPGPPGVIDVKPS